jgi:hypothetical protein
MIKNRLYRPDIVCNVLSDALGTKENIVFAFKTHRNVRDERKLL